MTEYIDREALLKEICNSCDGYCDIVDCDCLNCKSEHRCDAVIDIANAPAADVVKVRHGEWRSDWGSYYPSCSKCGEQLRSGYMENYCHNCGADMRKGEGKNV